MARRLGNADGKANGKHDWTSLLRKDKKILQADRSYYSSQFLADTMFLPFFPTEPILWIYGTLQGSIYTVYSFLSDKIALTTDIWEFAGQHLYYASQFLSDEMFLPFFPTGATSQQIYGTLQGGIYTICFPIKSLSLRMFGILQGSMYTMQVNSQQMQCFFLSFQHKQRYNGYMGLCKAAFILFALCFPIKSPSLRMYGTLQGNTYTMQVNSQLMQCFFLSFQQKQCYGYMGLCKAKFILFALCFPIKSPSLRIYGTLQGSTYTMQVNPLQTAILLPQLARTIDMMCAILSTSLLERCIVFLMLERKLWALNL